MLQLMKRTSAHPTAIWIYDRLKEDIENLSIGTVYRNLKVLLDQNMIKRIESGRNYDCYDADTTLHYHFLCSGCDAIYDLDLEPISELDNKVAEKTGFLVKEHQIRFYGLCKACQLSDEQVIEQVNIE